MPEDFKTFLLLHDGWKFFDEELSILSLDEMIRGTVYEWIGALKSEWGPGDRALEMGWVFVAAHGQNTVTFFDLSKKRRDGGLDVVEWDEGEVVQRYKSFTAYLKETLIVVKELIEENR